MMAKGRGKNELFGKTAYSYAEEVVQRMIGVKIDQYVSYEMQWGIDNEPLAVEAYERVKICSVTARNPQVRITHPDYDFISGEPDGLVGEDGLIECKCPNEANHFKNLVSGEQIAQYMYQIQGYIWLTGRQWCDFVSFSPNYPERYQLSVNRVVRDDEMIAKLEERCVQFWDEIVLPIKEQVERL